MEPRRPFLRPSPGEIEAAVKEHRERLRKFRIQQVREQSHKEAQRIRNKVEDSRKKCQDEVRSIAVNKWQHDKENRLLQLQDEYEGCVQSLGQAHGSAKDQPDPVALLSEQARKNILKAEKRNKEALKNEKENQIKENQQTNFQINQRKKAMHREKIRAKKVASLETPEAFKKKVCQIPKPPPTVKYHEAGTFTTSEYIPKNILIKKESGPKQIDARSLAAQEEDARKTKAESDARKQDQTNKKIELRGAEALRRERIHREYEDLVTRLDHTSKQHLARYLRGTDLSVHETPAERISGHEALEREMESAIERLMNDDSRYKRKHQDNDSAYATDLVDLTENLSAETSDDEGKSDLASLLKEIRRRREELLHESYSFKPSESAGSEEIPETTFSPRAEAQKDGNVEEIKTKDKINENYRRNEEENMVPRKDFHTVREHYERTDPLSNSIHFKETVPVDNIPEKSKERKPWEGKEQDKSNEQFTRPERPGAENQEDKHFQDNQNIYRNNNSINSSNADHSSNYDVDVEYSAEAETSLKKYSINENMGDVTGFTQASSSTEYISPPNSLPSKRLDSPVSKNPLDEAINNLKKIQEQRLANQRLLNQQKQNMASVPMVSSTPKPTYSQEIKMEGSGKRPKKKKEKFQEQKSKLLEYYAKKVINMKQDQLLDQMSDSVEGSHITFNSLTPLIDNIKKSSKDSLASTSFYLSSSNSPSSCSSNYPDIDEIPTRLSKSASGNISSSNLPFSNSNTNFEIIYESTDYSSDTVSINATSINSMTPQRSLSINSSSINSTPQQSLSINDSAFKNKTSYRHQSFNDSSVNNTTHQRSLIIDASSTSNLTPHRTTLSINNSLDNNTTLQPTLNIDASSIDSLSPQQSHSSDNLSQESTLFIHSNNELSFKEPSSQVRRMEILKKLQELQKIKSELLKQEEIASANLESEESSASSIDIDATAPFQNLDRITPTINNAPGQRRVSFRNHTRKELSTINEQETEVSDNVKFIDTSNSYHTPSKEFEETFSDSTESSQSTKQHLADMHSLLYDQHKYKSSQSNKDVMNKENTEYLSSSYDTGKQLPNPRDRLVPNTENEKPKPSNLPENNEETDADSSKESQFQTINSTLNLSNSPPTKMTSDYSEEKNTAEKSSAEKIAHKTLYLKGGHMPLAIVKSKIFPGSPSHKKLDSTSFTAVSNQKLDHSVSTKETGSTMVASNQKLGQSESTNAAFHQDLGHDSLADDSAFAPLAAEDTLNPGFDEENNISKKPHDGKNALAVNPIIQSAPPVHSNSESESAASMPDMADILQRFGMDWAKTMMKRMEKTEQNSSSDDSLHVK